MPEGPLVSTQWLADHLDDPGVRVVDCRWYLRPFDMRNGDDEYARAHIPGAVHARWDTDLADPERPDLWMLAGPDRFADAMASRGIGDDTFVVTYDDQHVTVAARGVVGAEGVRPHRRRRARRRHQQMAGRGPPHRPDSAPLPASAVHPPATTRASTPPHQDVLAALGTPTRLVDGRMAGAREADGGAIPGSITAPGIEFTGTDGTWAEPEEARRRLAAAGARAPEPTIAYCRGGVGACGTALAYAIAGHDDVAVYDGSWTEWITDPEAPRAMDVASQD